MSAEFLLKGFFAAIISAVMGFMVFLRCDREIGEERNDERQRYRPHIPGVILPTALVTLAFITLVDYGVSATVEITLTFCFAIFLHICQYWLLSLLYPF